MGQGDETGGRGDRTGGGRGGKGTGLEWERR